MKLIIVTIAATYLIACQSSDGGNAVRSQEADTASDTPVYNGIHYTSWSRNYDTYRSNECMAKGGMGNTDTTYMSGAWYVSTRGENRANIKIANPQETKIISGRKFFFEYIPELKSTRITNYKGTVTVVDHKRKIKLKANHTLLLDEKGKYKRFYNEDAGADSLWLTSSLLGLGSIGLPTLIYRMADRYSCNVQFRALLGQPLAIEDVTGDYNCKESLNDGLRMLQSVFMGDDSLEFSYSIKGNVVTIDPYKK